MKKTIKLNFINGLEEYIRSDNDFIQVVLGPRQVGKTTGIHLILEDLTKDQYHYASADGLLSRSSDWLHEQWLTLKTKNPNGLLVIDEIQKVENWSEIVKKLWDSQVRKKNKIRLILLGSSSIQIQKGLSESLTGRFQSHRVYHWNQTESFEAYGLSLEEFLIFGGYPGSYQLIQDRVAWLSYLRESIIDTVIGKDILNLGRVKSPALFRQCFDIATSYGGQEISYNKLLGQIQDRGNVELVKGYLEMFEGAFLLKQLYKFSAKPVVKRSSSPKILPLCPALYSNTKDGDLNEEDRGRAFEIAVGCELVRKPGQLYYWRQGKFEVDYIYQWGKKLFAIEVKSGRKTHSKGLAKFLEDHPNAEGVVVTPETYLGFLAKI